MSKLTEEQATHTLRFISQKPWKLITHDDNLVYVRMYVTSTSGALYQVIGGAPPTRGEDDLGVVYILRSDGQSIDACPSLFGLRWIKDVPVETKKGSA